jgi:hypothetical protein
VCGCAVVLSGCDLRQWHAAEARSTGTFLVSEALASPAFRGALAHE